MEKLVTMAPKCPLKTFSDRNFRFQKILLEILNPTIDKNEKNARVSRFRRSVKFSTSSMAVIDQSKLSLDGQSNSWKLKTGRYKNVRVLVTKLSAADAGLSALAKTGDA